MQLVSGRQYTFSFVPSGIDLSLPWQSQADSVLSQLLKDGFPLSGASAKSNGAAGGYLGTNSIEITATYIGSATDDQTFGEAMASDLTGNFFTASFTYNGATGGAAQNPGILDKFKAFLGITTGGSASTASLAWTTIAIIAGIFIVVIVAVYSVGRGAGVELAASV